MNVLYGIEQPAEVGAANDEYKRRYLLLLKKYKTGYLSHDNVDLVELSDWLKTQYLQIAAVRDGRSIESTEKGPRKRKGWKADLVTAWVTAGLGKTFDPKELAAELDVSQPTVYNWIKANRDRLLKVGRGQYQVVDRTDERKKK